MSYKDIIKYCFKLAAVIYIFNVFGYLIFVAGSLRNYSWADAFSPLKMIEGLLSGKIEVIFFVLLGIIFFICFNYWRTTKVDYWRGGRGTGTPW